MSRHDQRCSRAALNFPQEVQSAFEFLTTDYGLQCIFTEPTYVRYESYLTFVNVYHGRSSYELGLEVGLLGESPERERAFTLMELMRVQDPWAESNFHYFTATTPKQMRTAVARLAQLLKKYGADTLRGDRTAFERLSEERIRWRERFAKEVLLDQVKPAAEAAFRAKDYAKAVNLYESVRDDLTPVELKKLNYAKKQL